MFPEKHLKTTLLKDIKNQTNTCHCREADPLAAAAGAREAAEEAEEAAVKAEREAEKSIEARGFCRFRFLWFIYLVFRF